MGLFETNYKDFLMQIHWRLGASNERRISISLISEASFDKAYLKSEFRSLSLFTNHSKSNQILSSAIFFRP